MALRIPRRCTGLCFQSAGSERGEGLGRSPRINDIFMIPLPSAFKTVEKKGNKAVFEIEGLYPGYGVTIGNSLRRVLLSSLEGAAITQVKIKGVQHEFSTIPGILEDVLQITLRLKQIRCKLYGDEPQRIELHAKGEKRVTAKDFETPTQVEIVNKDAHIATLTTKNASLNLEATVERGLGYVPAEQRKKEKLEVGTIVLDAIFAPIRKVAFRVENMRVGERTDYDRLFLEIETDGTLAPEEALVAASEILASQFFAIQSVFPKKESEGSLEATEPAKSEIKTKKIKKLKKQTTGSRK